MQADSGDTVVLGAGMSGLGAALTLHARAYEATSHPGGVCHSFYVDEGGTVRDAAVENVSGCFRFEPAGGHWLFGVSDDALQRLGRFGRFRRYARRAAVWFPEESRLVPYPLQDNLRYLDAPLRNQILQEIVSEQPRQNVEAASFKDWLLIQFGPTLCEIFFYPFNERYTAGQYSLIAPQDAYKTAVDRDRVLQGAHDGAPDTGYNAIFYYPEGGLDHLTRMIASNCKIRYEHRVTSIDTTARKIQFANGVTVGYRDLISTIPLTCMMQLCGVQAGDRADPATAVLVVNVGAVAGERCPPYHWVYLPTSNSGMHRVGFYSHVDRSFLPTRYRTARRVVSLYAERSYLAGERPSEADLAEASAAIVAELQAWSFIGEPLTVHFGFTDPAYTWSWPGSTWVHDAKRKLAQSGIRQIGRYGAWRFQGMMASFEEGCTAGEALRAGDRLAS